MSDADRLREAADGLAVRAARYSPHNPSRQEWDATVALLRAVADEGQVCWCGPEYTERGLARPGCPAHDVMFASVDAALALASAILGDSDD